MSTLDLLYSGLIYATGGMLFLPTEILLVAAFVVLKPSRKHKVGAAGGGWPITRWPDLPIAR